jgi:DNA-binding NarL/FixJ family response regulator
MLKAPDIRVVGEAGHAEEVLPLMEKRSPHVVLMDVSVGEADGIDLLRRIKERWPKVSVVFLTMEESTLPLSRAIAGGCSGYLRKAIDRAQLVKTVRAIARGECIMDPALLRELLQNVSTKRAVEPTQRLTAPELDVLRLITHGRTNRQIAEEFRMSLGTVKDLVQKIIQKLDVSDRTHAAVKAVRARLID